MSTYGLEGVWSAWKTERLTAEQAIGQILQIMLEMDSRLVNLERKTSNPTVSAPTPKRRKKRRSDLDDMKEVLETQL